MAKRESKYAAHVAEASARGGAWTRNRRSKASVVVAVLILAAMVGGWAGFIAWAIFE